MPFGLGFALLRRVRKASWPKAQRAAKAPLGQIRESLVAAAYGQCHGNFDENCRTVSASCSARVPGYSFKDAETLLTDFFNEVERVE